MHGPQATAANKNKEVLWMRYYQCSDEDVPQEADYGLYPSRQISNGSSLHKCSSAFFASLKGPQPANFVFGGHSIPKTASQKFLVHSFVLIYS